MTIEEIKSKMSGEKYLIISKILINNIGHVETIVYTELITRYCNYKKAGKIKGNTFFVTIDDLEYECSVSKRQQQRIMKELEELGLIKVSYKGLPKRRHITILTNEEAVNAVFKDNREQKEKEPMPEEVKEVSRKRFDFEILDKEIDTATRAVEESVAIAFEAKQLYRAYTERFGVPLTYYSKESVKSVVRQLRGLNEEYYIFDSECFEILLDAYEDMTVEEKGYTRSINNMLSENIIKILHERVKNS